MSRLTGEEIEQIARIVGLIVKDEPKPKKNKWLQRTSAFLLENWQLTTVLFVALSLASASLFYDASPFYYFKKIAVEDAATSDTLNKRAYEKDLAVRHLKLGLAFLDQGLAADALREFNEGKTYSPLSIEVADAIRVATLFEANARGEYSPAVVEARISALFGSDSAVAESAKTAGLSANAAAEDEDSAPVGNVTVTNPHALWVLAEFRRVNGDTDSAELFREVLETRPLMSQAHLSLGHIAFDRRDYSGAAREYEAAHHIHPNNTEYLSNLASTRRILGDLDDAVTLFQRSERLDPDQLVTQVELSMALRGLGRFEQSAAVLNRLLRYLTKADIVSKLFAEGGKNHGLWILVIGKRPWGLTEREEKIAYIRASASFSTFMGSTAGDDGKLIKEIGQVDSSEDSVVAMLTAEVQDLTAHLPDNAERLDSYLKLLKNAASRGEGQDAE